MIFTFVSKMVASYTLNSVTISPHIQERPLAIKSKVFYVQIGYMIVIWLPLILVTILLIWNSYLAKLRLAMVKTNVKAMTVKAIFFISNSLYPILNSGSESGFLLFGHLHQR